MGFKGTRYALVCSVDFLYRETLNSNNQFGLHFEWFERIFRNVLEKPEFTNFIQNYLRTFSI